MLLLASSVCGLFKWRQFEPELILLAVGWYLRFSLSYRNVEELLAERGLLVDHVTVREEKSRGSRRKLNTDGHAAYPPAVAQLKVQVITLGSPWRLRALRKKALAAVDVTRSTEVGFDGFALFINGAVEVDPPPAHLQVSLVDPPGIAHRTLVGLPAFLKLWNVAFLPIKWPRIGSGNFALTELIASSTCRRSAVSLPVFRNCISSRTNSSKPSRIVSTFSITP
jgi:hypothetical protein